MGPDLREPVHHGAATGGTVVAILLTSASLFTGSLAWLAEVELPGWAVALVVLVVVGTVGCTLTWALRAGTTLEPERLRIVGAFTSREVPWRTIGAVRGGSSVAVLVDGHWLTLDDGGSPDARYREVRSWWTAHRGAGWRPPTSVPPHQDDVLLLGAGGGPPRGDDRPLVGWWGPPLMITVVLGAPVGFGLLEAIGLRGAVTVIGGVFVALGTISVVVHLVGAFRRSAAVSVLRLLVALGVLAAVAGATLVLRPLLPGA